MAFDYNDYNQMFTPQFQQNQFKIRDENFGGDQNAMNQWINNTYYNKGATNPYANPNEDYTEMKRIQDEAARGVANYHPSTLLAQNNGPWSRYNAMTQPQAGGAGVSGSSSGGGQSGGYTGPGGTNMNPTTGGTNALASLYGNGPSGGQTLLSGSATPFGNKPVSWDHEAGFYGPNVGMPGSDSTGPAPTGGGGFNSPMQAPYRGNMRFRSNQNKPYSATSPLLMQMYRRNNRGMGGTGF